MRLEAIRLPGGTDTDGVALVATPMTSPPPTGLLNLPLSSDKVMLSLKLHHVGCAVASIETGLRPYTHAMGFSRVSKIVDIASQKVRVCFIETAPGVFVELVQGLGEDSPVGNFLKRRQHYYHVCYSTRNVGESVTYLEAGGFQRLSVFTSEAFNGSDCAFLLTPEMALVELCTDGMFSLL